MKTKLERRETSKFDLKLLNRLVVAKILQSQVETWKDMDVEIIKNYMMGQDTNDIMYLNPLGLMNCNEHSVYNISFSMMSPITLERIHVVVNIERTPIESLGYPVVTRCISDLIQTVGTQDNAESIVSIWICLDPVSGEENTINQYHLAEEDLISKNKKTNDFLTAIMIYLNKQGANETEPMATDLEKMIGALNVLFQDSDVGEEEIVLLEEVFQMKRSGFMRGVGEY